MCSKEFLPNIYSEWQKYCGSRKQRIGCSYKRKIQNNRKWREENKGKFEIVVRKNWLESNYNITPEEYDTILKRQNNVCAICHNIDSGGRKLAVDHNHETGEIRGLLCSRCNRGIGFFMDDVHLLEDAIRYLA